MGEKDAATKTGFFSSIANYMKGRSLIMLALGFSSGLPFLLTGNTLGYWLREGGTSLTAIGFASWVGLSYSLKFLWAPLVDSTSAPLLGRFGRRRSWMLLAQLIVAAGLCAMGLIGPTGGLAVLIAVAVAVAFASATQDIVVDAWRIEAARSENELGLLSSSYQLGYRAALIVTDALILLSANHLGWPMSYGLMAALMIIGMLAALSAPEPAAQTASPTASPQGTRSALSLKRAFDAVAGPFVAFFKRHGLVAFLMLSMISLYRLPDFMMGPMANPFYHDLGLSKDVVGGVRASVGLIFSLLGIAAGGLFIQRFGQIRALIAGAVLQGIAVASFAVLAYQGAALPVFSAIMAADSFGISFAGVALVTYMSSLTSFGYTATQYALLSSAYAYVGKTLKGFSGQIVDHLALSHSRLEAYALFFMGAAAIGVPALLLCVLLSRVSQSAGQAN